jgi:hypothetical protein
MTFIPAEPAVPAEQTAKGSLVIRYEDISQTGKLLLDAMPVVLGPSLWQALAQHPASEAMREDGVVPVLYRLVLEGGEGPISVWSNVAGEGSFELAHTVGADGEVDRLVVNLWCDVYADAGRTYGPPPPNAGEKIRVARVFAQDVLTRPFAPKESRKVTRLVGPGLPPVPPARSESAPADATLVLPEGATPFDAAFVPDTSSIVFGLDHTDSNQHVNSLVYPRLFIEAALRRFWEHGRREPLVARAAAPPSSCIASRASRANACASSCARLPGETGSASSACS